MGELVRGELAEEDATRVIQPRDGGRVVAGNGIGADAGLAGGADAGGGEDVLQRERNAVQRAAVAAGRDLRLGRLRLADGVVGGDQEVGVQLRIERRRASEQGLRQVDGREVAARDKA